MNRIVLFLFGCIGVRLSLAYLAKVGSPQVLKIMSVLAGIISIGFLSIFAFGLRKTGIEVDGGEIWWNNYRPIHGLLFGAFAFLAWNNDPNAWKVLLGDALFGLFVWSINYFSF